VDHGCTRVENQGEGVAQIFANIPGGMRRGLDFLGKIFRESPILGFIPILLTRFLKI
jgi:hypothetical protein